MFRILRRLRRDERGQAMVLGVVVMLVLAVTIMTSVGIGQGVYEKIKLQDAADAQAYSLAVKEARAYNFLAYTNRAMIVHYSAMLTLMSYVSHAVYLDRTIGVAAKYLQYIPGIGAIFMAVSTAIKTWKVTVETVSRLLIPVLTALNIALWLAQEAMLTGTLFDLYTTKGHGNVIQQTDPRAEVTEDMDSGQSFNNASVSSLFGNPSDINYSNAKNFLHVLDDGPFSSSPTMGVDPTGMLARGKLVTGNKLSDPNMAKYRLLMGNLANGVRRRWTAEGEGPILIGRRWEFNLCVVIGQLRIRKTADSQIKSFDENFENNRKDQLFASDDIRIEVRPTCFLFGWKDVFRLRFRAAADNRGGFHQEYGSNKTDDHHPWLGITPFITSDTSFVSPRQNHFGYPCNLIVLGKDMGAERSGKKPVYELENLKNNAFMEGSGDGKYNTAENNDEAIRESYLDMTWEYVGGKQDGYAADFRQRTGGMMAMAVGRAIYHRPGAWKEEPNFFNPLWTARLAPVQTHWDADHLKWLVPAWEDSEWLIQGINY
ncbi:MULTISPECIES: pilus assembly protein [unclassified Corallococcus]|uniref:pilus assembly protein n=1 Tax=unclassified Corallococcus TaxID=2685029 RepID=UPI001CBC26C3|nr:MULTISPECIES: pilus assembly protein [unclassified Corallococcus]MBZ4334215.1 pilus assembly protein [Corallococcus sp. AS-1-12]MBZ4374853.1 pilus assembly protein [Corallococcus sp. AS-1-6]